MHVARMLTGSLIKRGSVNGVMVGPVDEDILPAKPTSVGAGVILRAAGVHRVPNWAARRSSGRFWKGAPTQSCAMRVMVSSIDRPPWWYRDAFNLKGRISRHVVFACVKCKSTTQMEIMKFMCL